MTKEQLLALGLTEQQASTIEADYQKSYKPLVDYQALEATNTTQSGRLSSIEKMVSELVKDSKGSTLEEKVSVFGQSIETERDKFKKELEAKDFDRAIEKALLNAKPKSERAQKAIMANLALDKLKLNTDGSVTGLDEQIKAIKESDAFLFEEEVETLPNSGGTGDYGYKGKKDSDKTSIGERIAKQIQPTETENPYFK